MTESTGQRRPDVVLLYFEGCPTTDEMRENLRDALAMLQWPDIVKRVDISRLPDDDDRLRWGSPTLLVDGADLLQHTPGPERALSCRVYPDGVPSAAQIAALLRR